MPDSESFFAALRKADAEDSVDSIISNQDGLQWHPLGGNQNNYGVIENQQASPIGSLIEKLTNSIDATLMKKCFELGIDPRSISAPRTMQAAIEQFFESTYRLWHLGPPRKEQAREIQIIASGSKKSPCLTIYDNGEGQHPDDFEDTLLSLLRGNKNDIPFVQGKYNMGGTGAIVFCGTKRYQLIGSRRFDGTGNFGFTLVRKHPLSEEERNTVKNTWYEYFKIDGQIPRFPITELDIGLSERKFVTGTILKLYDYELPQGTRGALPQEPRRAIDQFLFEPALPIYLVDSKTRYPNNKVLEGDCFGLKRRIEHDENKYVEDHFTEVLDDHLLGKLKATCYIFKSRVEGRSVKETRDILRREYFHDNRAVLFSMNGQIQGHYTSEFISRALKMQLLKNHLLIHVDCTSLSMEFRQELFMASRDRLKKSPETDALRKKVAELLKTGRLADIYKKRKNSISVEGGDAKDLLKAFSKNLPFNKELMNLLNQTFKIDRVEEKGSKKDKVKKPKPEKIQKPFDPKRYPSFFNLQTGKGRNTIQVQSGKNKTIQFTTDVENHYFTRSDDPGDLQISILTHKRNESTGGDQKGEVAEPDTLLDVQTSSPSDGTIRIGLSPTEDLQIGDEVEVEARLGGPRDLGCLFWIKIIEPEKKKAEVAKESEDKEPPMGLPEYKLVYKSIPEENQAAVTWDKLEEAGISIDYDVVMHPHVDGETQMEAVYINMDSRVLRSYISKQGGVSVEQKELAEKKYISSVYFHTIFLYSITRNKKYLLHKENGPVDLGEYLQDIFSSYYSEFLLNFGTDQLMASLAD